MKKIVAVMVLSVIGTSVFSQSLSSNVEYPVSPVIAKKFGPGNYEPEPPGLKMRNTGRTLTIIGGALFVGGIFVLSSADEMYYNSTTTSSGTTTEGDPKAALGILMMTGGAGMAIPGIIFWSKGSKKYNQYLKEQEASFKLKGAGISLNYRF